MPIFPHLEFDQKIQINDKIRISGSKSFVSAGTAAISTMTIKPEDDIVAISVYNADENLRYLDWAYLAFEMDIDSTNNKIDFSEGSTEFQATLTSGTYTLATLADEIETQMSAEGANTYTVSVSDLDKITISANGSFSLLPSSENILEQLGFFVTQNQSLSNGTTFTGKRIRYLTRKITLSANNGTGAVESVGYVKVYSSEGDYLFSEDSDLIPHEPDILKWLPAGKNTYNYVHRRAQELILAWLDEKGYMDVYQEKFTIDSIVDMAEVTEWSKFMVLRLIFESIKNAADDVFAEKALTYLGHEKAARNRVVLRLDIDGDGDVDNSSQEYVGISTINSARR